MTGLRRRRKRRRKFETLQDVRYKLCLKKPVKTRVSVQKSGSVFKKGHQGMGQGFTEITEVTLPSGHSRNLSSIFIHLESLLVAGSTHTQPLLMDAAGL